MNFDIITDVTVDNFVSLTSYPNVPWTDGKIYVSEGATLSQTNAETLPYLYVVELTLGENSLGTAVIKNGFVDFSKAGFDLILIPAGVIPVVDILAPKAVTLSTLTEWQDNSVPVGRSMVNLVWQTVTENEVFPQYVGDANGGTQTMDLTFDPVVVGSESVYEVYGYTVGGGSTALSAVFSADHDILRVSSVTGFTPGCMVEVDNGSVKKFYIVDSIQPGLLYVSTSCDRDGGFAAGSTVKQVDFWNKAPTLDYTVNYSMGTITLVAGQFLVGNKVIVFYTPQLQDLDHYELYRVIGDHPVGSTDGHQGVTRDAVTAYPGVVIVSDSIPPSNTNWTETMDSSQNGKTWTYYLVAVDSNVTPNYARASSAMFETIPSIPQNPVASVSSNNVELAWDALPGSETNTDGFNVFRCVGPVFTDGASYLLNSSLISKITPIFEDGPHNHTNRRPNSEVPFPQNGYVYSYKIESEDSVTAWLTGTKNADAETGAAQLTASKPL